MRKKFWPPFRVQDAAEKADVSWQRCREGSCPFMGLMRVNYSLTESEKKISEAWSLPRVYTSLQNLRSQLSSKPAVLQCQSREERQKALFLRFIGEVWTKYWCWCSAENLDLGQYALLRKKPSGWVSQMSVLIQLKEPPVKENRFNIKAMVSQSSLAKITLPLTRWLRHTEEKQKLKSQSQSFETKMARRSVCGAEEGGWWWWMVECVCWMSEMCVVDACDKKEYSLKDQQPLIWHHLNLTVLQFNSTLT